ncbi:MAG TPA: DUF4011 domain-containing protein, partial [Tepidisphaeraceae bacterium]|nr:DUF4011 domain-containing protein [Tepidisphaeraceae bacterium]
MSQDTDVIEQKLEQTRRRLLDLTRANRLLNHRPRGQRTLRIVEERPAQVFDLLVNQQKTMQFLAREEAPPELAGRLPPEDDPDRLVPAGLDDQQPPPDSDQQHELSLPPIAKGHARAGPQEDRCLQTLLPGPKLQTRLVKLAREATSSLQEQGANILYLTLGVVKWRESDAPSQDACAAPLLFIPVSLWRPNVQTRHSLALFDDDILVNPCLLELCRRQFRFELPDFDPEAEDADLDQYQQQVRLSLTQLPGWSYEPQINLGLFSFSKLLMYRDLDPKNWPADKQLARHRLIRLFSGEAIDPAELGESIPDPAGLDETVHPNDCYQVVDADSSQQAAILAAKRGGSIVIEGPPGTGKSQTITNIIAECLSEGRSVLFVAEKSAALEVVRRRLENVGLGEFVLELHSRKASKKAVLAELGRVLAMRDRPRVMDVDATELQHVRRQLNDYSKQLHTPISRLNLSPFQIIARASVLADEPEAEAQLTDVFNWTAQDLTDARERLCRLDARLSRTGDPNHHPWRGVRLDNVDLQTRQQVVAAARSLAAAPLKLLESARRLASLLGAPEPKTVAQIQSILSDAALLLHTPVIAPALVADERWNCPTQELKQWLADGMERSGHKARWAAAFHPDAGLIDWTPVLHRRRLHGGSILRILRPSWRQDTWLIRSKLLDPARLPPLQEQLALLQALVNSAQLQQRLLSLQSQYAPQFGDAWHGIESDFQHLLRLADTLPAVRQAIGAARIQLDAAQRILGTDRRDDLRQAITVVQQDLQQLGDDLEHWLNVVRSNEPTWLKQPLAQTDLAELHQLVEP